MLGVSGIVLRACQPRPSPDTYDEFVADFGPRVVSYWRFDNSGADAKGTQHATITGSPELNVETIVDLDTVAEGAPADGECIAWSGTGGVYAEAAHNPAHKTAEGSIVVTFQRDAQSLKSTLVAADRSVGGTSTGPGGLSIEVETNGAPRCFLRRQSDGAAVILLGQAGDVALNEAYTLIFKWGAPGLSLALWNEDGTLVRRLTDPLTDGVTGTSAIRFGLWHDGSSSPHDGPFGRVIWLDRRIGDAEEADLARARTISREPAGGSQYTPFPFVTISNPPVDHTGVANRPGFSASDPRSASFIDPVSGLEVFRVGGNNGANVMINGTTDSGLNYPRRLRNQNNTKTTQDWNSDGTLLMVSRRYEVSGDASSAASSYILDCDGSHGASVPWRVVRAGSNRELGDSVGALWFWDHLNPLRAYVIRSNNIAEWWPIGAPGHSVGEVNTLFGLPSGFNYTDIARYGLYSSIDGVWHHLQTRRNSDGKRGGMRVNLHTGATNNFVPNPFQNADHSDRAVEATLPLGLYGAFTPVDLPAPNFNWRRFVNMTNGQEVSNQDNSSSEITHVDSVYVDGKEYYIGQDSGIRLWDVVSGGWSQRSNFPGGNPEHIGCRNQEDTCENYGATGGSTTGQRYAVWVRSNTERLIWGIRICKDDFNVSRVICAHRSLRSTNANECHPKPDRKMEKLVFPSNWHEPGVVSDGDVHPYVVIIPDAWRSPNNDGS